MQCDSEIQSHPVQYHPLYDLCITNEKLYINQIFNLFGHKKQQLKGALATLLLNMSAL